MQTRAPIFEDLADLMTGTMGAAQGVGDEMRAVMRAQAERLIADMDLVGRDEFEAMKVLAVSAQAEAEALKARIEALEKAAAPKSKRPAARKKTTKTRKS